jgi:hypothetical protein
MHPQVFEPSRHNAEHLWSTTVTLPDQRQLELQRRGIVNRSGHNGRKRFRMISPQQYRSVMRTYAETENVSGSARKAGVDWKTAERYVAGAPGPGEPGPMRGWRTHPDAFVGVWEQVEAALRRDAELQAKTLFEDLQRQHPGQFAAGQRRTFERRVQAWKRRYGPEPEVVFVQVHRPGERWQLDWVDATWLAIGIGGEILEHKLCHVVLPYSNWEWTQRGGTESFASLRAGLQAAASMVRVSPW